MMQAYQSNPFWLSIRLLLLVTGCFFLHFDSFAQVDLQNGLVACYPFTGHANDASGNGNHGTVHGATLTADRFGNFNRAYHFNGAGAYISIPPEHLKINQFSYSLWVKANSVPATGTSYFIFSIGSEYGDQSVGLNQVYSGPNNGWTGGGYSAVGENQFYATGVLPPTNTWTHLVVTRNSSLLKLYVDGQLAGSASVAGKTPFYGTGTVAATIGGRSTLKQYFDGDVDDLRLYNRALSAAEVTELYTNAPPCEPAPDLTMGLLACYAFTGTAEDVSGNDNHGTVNGAILTTDRFGNANSAFSFDGNNDYVIIPPNQFQTNNYTYSIWANPAAIPSEGNTYRLLSIGGNGGDQDASLSNSYVTVSKGWDGAGYNTDGSVSHYSVGSVPALNTWYHLTVTRNNTSVMLYVNGQPAGTGPTNGLSPYYGSGIVQAIIGGRSTLTQFFHGAIDDIRLYNRALSAEEVSELYKAPDLQALVVQASNITPCAGTEATFSAAPAPGGDTRYQWKVNGVNQGGPSDSPSFAYTFANNSSSYTATVSVEATSKASCRSAAGQTTVAIQPKTVPTLTVQADNATPCAETPVQFTAASNVANGLYQWKIDGINQGAPTASNSFSTNFANASQPYQATISVEITTQDACTFPGKATAQTMVTVSPLKIPHVAILTNDPVPCVGSSATFTANTDAVGPVYQWQVNGINQGSPGNLAVFTHTFTHAQPTTVSVEVTSSQACTSPATATYPISVISPTVLSATISTNNADPCVGTPIEFIASTNAVTPTYQWKINGVAQGVPTNASTFSYAFADPGNYTVEVEATSSAVCPLFPIPGPATAQTTVAVNPSSPFPVSLTASNQAFCAGKEATFTVTPAVTGATYQWKLDGANRGAVTSVPVFVYNFPDKAQQYQPVVSVEVFPNQPCTASVIRQTVLDVYSNPVIACIFPDTVAIEHRATYRVIATGGRPPYTYDWVFEQDTIRAWQQDTIGYAYAVKGDYEAIVIATDQSGCQAVCRVAQHVIRPLFFPNVFTPNGDTHNDTFTIQYEGKDFAMRIYNRWGELVAKTTDGWYGWDGQGCPAGLYYYQITLASKEYKGWLSLLR